MCYNFLEHARDRRVCLCPRSAGIEDIWDTNRGADDGDATDVHDEHTAVSGAAAAARGVRAVTRHRAGHSGAGSP